MCVNRGSRVLRLGQAGAPNAGRGCSGQRKPAALSGAVQQESRQLHKGDSNMVDYPGGTVRVQTERESRRKVQSTQHNGRHNLR